MGMSWPSVPRHATCSGARASMAAARAAVARPLQRGAGAQAWLSAQSWPAHAGQRGPPLPCTARTLRERLAGGQRAVLHRPPLVVQPVDGHSTSVITLAAALALVPQLVPRGRAGALR